MEIASSDEHLKRALPFVGRRKEAARLERLHSQRRHALILGPAGVGKTSLVNHLKEKLGLLVCPQSERLGALCESLEAGLGLGATSLRLPQRKQRLLRALTGAKCTVVFDGVNWTTPKLSSFLEGVMERVPVIVFQLLCVHVLSFFCLGHHGRF